MKFLAITLIVHNDERSYEDDATLDHLSEGRFRPSLTEAGTCPRPLGGGS